MSLIVSCVVIFLFLALAYFCLKSGYPKVSLGIIGIPLLGIIGYLTFQKKNKNPENSNIE